MNRILDAGTLIGIGRNNRRVAALMKLGPPRGTELLSPAPVLHRPGAKSLLSALKINATIVTV